MITCESCGKPNPADMSNCQYCRAPLTGQSRGKTNGQEQIPAWLESLKASERPTPPAHSQDSFSVADLVDSNALPGWMRPDSAELARNGDSNKFPVLRPAGTAGPNTDSAGTGVTPGSLSAGSLIDSASLPSWMRSAPAGQPDAISASSLVEPESLPGWLTEQASMPSRPPQPSQSPQPPQTWQAGQQPPFQQPAPPAQVSPTSPSTWQDPTNLQGGGDRPDSGIAGSSLLDMQALPQWLREEGQNSQQSTGQGGGLSASSLIDMNGLPDWLRTADQVPQSGYSTQASTNAFGGSGVYGAPAGHGTPPRAESMRVPSRPRPEMVPPEQSEVAANVFSSMLGVASISPSYPASSMPVTQQPFQAPGQIPQFPSAAGNPYAQPGMPSSTQGNVPNTFAGGPQPGYPGTAYGPAPAWPQGQLQETRTSGPTETTGTKTARRGFLETIRGWFHL